MRNYSVVLRLLVLIGILFCGILAILVVLFGSRSCSWITYFGKREALTIATLPTEVNAVLYVAEDQNFFTRNGLQVTLKEDYDSGATAAAGML